MNLDQIEQSVTPPYGVERTETQRVIADLCSALRAALAARPEPIGYYVLARQTERGSWSSTGVMSRIEAEAARERWEYLADDTLYALLPVDGTP